MRLLRLAMIAFGGLGLLIGQVSAQESCPPDCAVKGGGRPDTDCLLEFSGAPPLRPGSRLMHCRDGDPTCDLDGTLNGECRVAITACLNNADPSLPSCIASGIERVRVRGRGQPSRDLQAEIDALLPTSESTCTNPVEVTLPVRTRGGELGTRNFTIDPAASVFGINIVPMVGNFEGTLVLHAGAPRPELAGLAYVDVVESSEYILSSLSIGGAVCIRVVPTERAGVISCGRRSGKAFRFSALGSGAQLDRDSLGVICEPNVNFSTSLTENHNLGVVGEEGFTQADCDAAGGTVEGPSSPHPGVCNGPIEAAMGDEFDPRPGAMILAPLEGSRNPCSADSPSCSQAGERCWDTDTGNLCAAESATCECQILPVFGLPVEIVIEDGGLPCGDEGAGGISTAIAVTTERFTSSVTNPGNSLEAPPLETGLEGENFSCLDFSEEDGPGGLVFSAPQLDLEVFGGVFLDIVTEFRFFDSGD